MERKKPKIHGACFEGPLSELKKREQSKPTDESVGPVTRRSEWEKKTKDGLGGHSVLGSLADASLPCNLVVSEEKACSSL